MRKWLVMAAVAACLAPLLAKKKKEETQVLELPRDPPLAVAVKTRNLTFHVSPLSAKGLLSQQTREAVRVLLKSNEGGVLVKIRAFVAGTGDMRRVPAIVSETLTDKKIPLPVVSVVQVGGLPLEGAQVQLESISEAKREIDPRGLIFAGGQAAVEAKPLQSIAPLAERALASLERQLDGNEAVRVTCFTTSLDDAPKLGAQIVSRFGRAVYSVVQSQRGSPRTSVSCEATARLTKDETSLDGLQAVAVTSPQMAFTGTQVAFGFEDKDARLAFDRVGRALAPLGASSADVVVANYYPLSGSIAEQVRRVQSGFFDAVRRPVGTTITVEGLPSTDASFALDLAAVIHQ